MEHANATPVSQRENGEPTQTQETPCSQCFGKGWNQSTRDWQPYRAECTVCHGTGRQPLAKQAPPSETTKDKSLEEPRAAIEPRSREGQITLKWIPTSERLPEVCQSVIGYADKWVHPDYNEMGMRECFRNDDEWWSGRLGTTIKIAGRLRSGHPTIGCLTLPCRLSPRLRSPITRRGFHPLISLQWKEQNHE